MKQLIVSKTFAGIFHTFSQNSSYALLLLTNLRKSIFQNTSNISERLMFSPGEVIEFNNTYSYNVTQIRINLCHKKVRLLT